MDPLLQAALGVEKNDSAVEYGDGAKFTIQSISHRSHHAESHFPFKTTDLSQIVDMPKGLSPVQDYMFKMFHKPPNQTRNPKKNFTP